MDGVLVDISSSWFLVHSKLNVDSKINLVNYLNNKIDYQEFMKRDINLWGKIHIKTIKEILYNAPLMSGIEETIVDLKNKGYKIMILSSGISLLAEKIKNNYKLDYCLANEICVDKDGYITGEGIGNVPLLEKLLILNKFIIKEKFDEKNIAVIGDSIYDIPLFEKFNYSIAFNAKSDIMRKARIKIDGKNLINLLQYF